MSKKVEKIMVLFMSISKVDSTIVSFIFTDFSRFMRKIVFIFWYIRSAIKLTVIHYLENKVGVVDFANAQTLVILQNLLLPLYVKGNNIPEQNSKSL